MSVNCAVNFIYMFRAGIQVFKFVLGLYAKHMQIVVFYKSLQFFSPALVTNNCVWRGARWAPPLSGRPGGGGGPGGRAVPEAVPGRSLGGARDAPSWPAAWLDLSLSPPRAAAAPLVAPRLQNGPSDSSLGQFRAGSWSFAQLPLVADRDPSTPELRATLPSPWRCGGSRTLAAAGS